MTTATEHGQIVLSAILPDRRDLLDIALRNLSHSHFVDPTQAIFFQLLQRYADVTQGVMSEASLSDMLRGRDAARVTLYLETYNAMAHTTVSDADFQWSLSELRELAAERATEEMLVQGREILKKGLALVGDETLKGHKDARQYLMESVAEIDRDLTMQASPEGDLRKEKQDILSDYAEHKKARLNGSSQGILFGIDGLDAKIGGLQNGELILSVGYSSDGKTSLCVQLAWHAAIKQGKNVVFLTTETLRPQVIRKIVARHSKEAQFDLPEGLNTRDLKNGTLSDADEEKFKTVVTDLEKNSSYGKIYVVQVPRGATISTIEATLYRIQRSFNIDLVIHDYLALTKSSVRRGTEREEMSSIIKEAKQLATTFDNGRGVPFVSPWQVNRAARDNASRLGYYTSASLAETAEATNSADVIISILAPDDNSDRYCDLTGQILKNRDGETTNSLQLQVDYATSWFKSKSIGSPMINPSSSSGGLGSFL